MDHKATTRKDYVQRKKDKKKKEKIVISTLNQDFSLIHVIHKYHL